MSFALHVTLLKGNGRRVMKLLSDTQTTVSHYMISDCNPKNSNLERWQTSPLWYHIVVGVLLVEEGTRGCLDLQSVRVSSCHRPMRCQHGLSAKRSPQTDTT